MIGERDKHFLLAMFTATGIILFWKGIWEGVGSLPFLENPWVSLFVGAAMLTLSGIIFSEFDPLGGIERGIHKIIHHVNTHPKRHEFYIKYHDAVQKKERKIHAKNIIRIEKNIISYLERGREVFIPIHRIRSVHRKGKVVWKL